MPSLPFEQKREFIVKAEEEPLDDYGKVPHKHSIEELLQKGIINIDKPEGPSSTQVSDWVKSILHAKRAGHSGTLDPKVSGVFPVGINQGTKVLKTLLEAGKEYVCLMHLHDEVPPAEIKKALKSFTGKVFQRPPVFSAVKRLLRIREIYYNELLEIDKKDVLFRTGCGAGTYIRRLCYDIGLSLETGAHMQQLRRTKVGVFTDETAVTLQELSDAYVFWKEDNNEKPLREIVIPMETGLSHLAKIIISDYAINSVCHGAQLAVPGILKFETGIKPNELVAVFSQKGEAVMYGRALLSAEELKRSKKGFAIQTERVFMPENYYPRFKKA